MYNIGGKVALCEYRTRRRRFNKDVAQREDDMITTEKIMTERENMTRVRSSASDSQYALSQRNLKAVAPCKKYGYT